jgi:hypothetical protein
MANHAMWVHGTSVRPEWIHDNLQQVRGATWDSVGADRDVPWSDVNGLPRGWGATFGGKRAFTGGLGGTTVGPANPANPFIYSQKGYWFHFAIPTPVIVADARSRLLRVFVLWETAPGVEIWAAHIYDGIDRIAALPAIRATLQPTGRRGATDLVEGVSMFTLPVPHVMRWSVGISVAAAFLEDGNITFFSAGADFST